MWPAMTAQQQKTADGGMGTARGPGKELLQAALGSQALCLIPLALQLCIHQVQTLSLPVAIYEHWPKSFRKTQKLSFVNQFPSTYSQCNIGAKSTTWEPRSLVQNLTSTTTLNWMALEKKLDHHPELLEGLPRSSGAAGSLRMCCIKAKCQSLRMAPALNAMGEM